MMMMVMSTEMLLKVIQPVYIKVKKLNSYIS